jgi:hypothetical protein
VESVDKYLTASYRQSSVAAALRSRANIWRSRHVQESTSPRTPLRHCPAGGDDNGCDQRRDCSGRQWRPTLAALGSKRALRCGSGSSVVARLGQQADTGHARPARFSCRRVAEAVSIRVFEWHLARGPSAEASVAPTRRPANYQSPPGPLTAPDRGQQGAGQAFKGAAPSLAETAPFVDGQGVSLVRGRHSAS